jgi:hypothetical protein
MGFTDLDARNESRIVGPFGVPPILIGTRVGLSAATYSNYEEARRGFWQDTMLPESKLFETEYRYYLSTEAGEFVAYDYSEVPALQVNTEGLIASAFQLWQMGVAANTAFEYLGLNIGNVPGGDIGYVPAGMVPVGYSAPSSSTEEGQITATSDERSKAFSQVGVLPHLLEVKKNLLRNGSLPSGKRPTASLSPGNKSSRRPPLKLLNGTDEPSWPH